MGGRRPLRRQATTRELARSRLSTTWVVAGPAVASDAVLSGLGARSVDGAVRLQGADRCDTARAIAVDQFTAETREVCVASGESIPDAMAAGAAGAAEGSPLVLTTKGSLPAGCQTT